jgi:hypothetical protein
MMICVVLASCAGPKIVDTGCAAMPRGTAHKDDTPKTKRWMRTYETARQERCK